jgi:PBP1b-binding outer membrane lipoprotein LpoB
MTISKIILSCIVLCLCFFVGCSNKEDNKASQELEQSQGQPLSEAVNTDGVPHAITYTIEADGTVSLVAGSQPTSRPK